MSSDNPEQLWFLKLGTSIAGPFNTEQLMELLQLRQLFGDQELLYAGQENDPQAKTVLLRDVAAQFSGYKPFTPPPKPQSASSSSSGDRPNKGVVSTQDSARTLFEALQASKDRKQNLVESTAEEIEAPSIPANQLVFEFFRQNFKFFYLIVSGLSLIAAAWGVSLMLKTRLALQTSSPGSLRSGSEMENAQPPQIDTPSARVEAPSSRPAMTSPQQRPRADFVPRNLPQHNLPKAPPVIRSRFRKDGEEPLPTSNEYYYQEEARSQSSGPPLDPGQQEIQPVPLSDSPSPTDAEQ